MACFDRLPRHLRDWINYCEVLNLHDDHIMGGEKEVERCVQAVARGDIYRKPGNGQN